MTLDTLTGQLHLALPDIRGMGSMAFDPIWSQKMHIPSNYELILVQKGRLNLVTHQGQFTAHPNQILLIPPQTEHRDEFNLEQGLEVFIIFYQWSCSQAYYRLVNNNRLAALHYTPSADILARFQLLRNRLNTISPADQLALRVQLLDILTSLLADVQQLEQPAETQETSAHRCRRLMQRACDYLSRHFNECVALDDIADALNISPYYLSHIFSEQSGFSLFAYLTSLRLEKACAMLRDPANKVSQVAQAVGYDNANYFAKVFKKHYGCSPSQYARRRSSD